MTFKRQKILAPLQDNLARRAHVLQILTGPRQVGKTTAIHQFLDEWPDPKAYATADQLTPPDTHPAVQRIDHPALFRQTLALACRHPAEIISLQKLLGQLQDRGSINTLANYLELIAGAFLVEPVRKYSPRAIRVRASSPKLIARNNAVVTALRGVPFEETLRDRPFYGRLVENAVGAAFLNAGDSVFYWSERKDKEVDFIVQRGKDLLAVEVTAGDGHPTPGLTAFLSRYPDARPVHIGGANSDLSVERFLEHGL